jgi:hypothetical protein
VNNSAQGFNAAAAAAGRAAIPAQNLDAYKTAIARSSDYVIMLGQMIGTTAVRLMREEIHPVDAAAIWGGQQRFTCPGRERLDAANPARENVFPGYKEGADVDLKVGLLRIGEINFVTVNGEVYSQIALKLKQAAPANKTMMVTLAQRGRELGLHLFRRCVQPSDLPGDRLTSSARLRGRKDHLQRTRSDAQIRGMKSTPSRINRDLTAGIIAPLRQIIADGDRATNGHFPRRHEVPRRPREFGVLPPTSRPLPPPRPSSRRSPVRSSPLLHRL